jgi:hypothetical protein
VAPADSRKGDVCLLKGGERKRKSANRKMAGKRWIVRSRLRGSRSGEFSGIISLGFSKIMPQ